MTRLIVSATAHRAGEQSYSSPPQKAKLTSAARTYANVLRQWNVHRQWVGPLPCRRNQKTSDVPLQLESKLCTRGGLANSSPACSKQ